ncbi:hypothetical protein PR202_ga00250 [Eleusine coracana subsp. coracana]|uniref:Uncharacterized protein n=1 Tax=Eleusine coracana subsp. coracana TaxID=191504 RepID=A0AAV5BGK0_ELECO|nr:hypothetical protein QOZ80_2AG0124760 [Eleusine coracana subsp. coracana]GJM84567.1 hypothetical protein PR202_ga00250 [Eleusine coracana subsp. coracana]
MPPSVAAAGQPSRSASAIVADTTRGYHILRIDGYSLTKAIPTGESLKSQAFTVGRHRWFIRYYPNGFTSDVSKYVSLFLVRDGAGEAVKAQYQIRFADEVKKTTSLALREVASSESRIGCGCKKFVKRKVLEKSKHLKDDSFSVRCDIVVFNEFRAEEEEAPGQAPMLCSRWAPRHLAAHRCVLAIRSPVFSAELFGTMKEGDTAGVVCIDDMEAQVFKALLHFVYTDSLPKGNKQEEEAEEDVMSQHLLVAADRYNLERLKLKCEEKLCRYINIGTVGTILTLAEQHHCHGLKKACFGFLSSPANLKAATATDGFNHLSKSCPSVLKELLAMPRT